jgi:hypothetical protein
MCVVSLFAHSVDRFRRSCKSQGRQCGWLLVCPDLVAREVSGHLALLGWGFEMDRARIHEGVCRMRFEDVLGRSERSELSQMEIEHIPAYSPQVRGRSERVCHTLQDRLPKEFKLAGIDMVEAANVWLRDSFITEHNGWFATTRSRRARHLLLMR